MKWTRLPLNGFPCNPLDLCTHERVLSAIASEPNLCTPQDALTQAFASNFTAYPGGQQWWLQIQLFGLDGWGFIFQATNQLAAQTPRSLAHGIKLRAGIAELGRARGVRRAHRRPEHLQTLRPPLAPKPAIPSPKRCKPFTIAGTAADNNTN